MLLTLLYHRSRSIGIRRWFCVYAKFRLHVIIYKKKIINYYTLKKNHLLLLFFLSSRQTTNGCFFTVLLLHNSYIYSLNMEGFILFLSFGSRSNLWLILTIAVFVYYPRNFEVVRIALLVANGEQVHGRRRRKIVRQWWWCEASCGNW